MRRAAILLALVSLLPLGSSAPGRAASLPVVSQGPRPGPPVLYEPLATAPQLQNGPGWAAAPLMVSGAQAYDSGEYLYQDYIYDSFGANTTDVPFLPPDPVPNAGDVAFGGQTGDVVYPTNVAVYGNNAADILEFRARLQDGNVVYRVTLNTLLDASAAAVAIGVDSGPGGADDWGYGIGSLGDLNVDHVILGTGGDLATNQIEIPSTLVPAGGTWRHYVVVGLWDAATSTFKAILDEPTATSPGGAHGTTPPPIFNVGFRFNELAVRGDIEGTIADPLGSSGTRTVGAGHWREHAQAKALAGRDISAMHADIDFSKVAAGTDDFSDVPTTGFIARLYASRLELGEGAKPERPMLLGKIQPYGVYVPTTYSPSSPAPLTLALHSLSCSYNQYAVFAPRLYQELGEERGAIVLTTEGRGPDGWYHDAAEYDLFEAWNDLANRYAIDSDRVTISGYSMGGYATWKIGSQYPDLFGSGFAVVGPGGENILHAPTNGLVDDVHGALGILDNLRNVPVLAWYGTNDELVPLAGATMMARRMLELGYEHEIDIFPGFDHFLFSLLDQWRPGRFWLDQRPVNRYPGHVTYRVRPAADNAGLGLIHDHAYWIEDIRVVTGAATGLIDAEVSAVGVGYRHLEPIILPAGTDPAPHAKSGFRWSGQGAAGPGGNNDLYLKLDGVSSATMWPQRGGISTSIIPLTVHATSTHAATITLAGSFGTRVLSIPSGDSTFVFTF